MASPKPCARLKPSPITPRKPSAAEFYGNTTVMDIEVVNGQVKAVVTDKGRIETDKVLVCAGIWGPRIGRMVGEVIPLTPVQHQYVKTAPIPELADDDRGSQLPHGCATKITPCTSGSTATVWGIGSYQHEPLLVDPDNILPYAEAPVMPSVKAFHRRAFRPRLGIHYGTFPRCGKNAELTYKINGMFSFTPDSGSVIGESTKAKGFWVAEAVWVTHGGGVGKIVAELMTTGVPSLDIHEMDIHRFPDVCKSGDFITARRGAAVRRGVRHHSSLSISNFTRGTCGSARFTPACRNSVPNSSSVRAGNGPSGSSPTLPCWKSTTCLGVATVGKQGTGRPFKGRSISPRGIASPSMISPPSPNSK
jgi:hypothetical protein